MGAKALSRYWLNTSEKDHQVFQEQVHEVCDTYQDTLAHHEVDEMAGIQALERIAPTKATGPGLVERREFEYKRHGTLTLIAHFTIATRQVPVPSLGLTRTGIDFAEHSAQTIAIDPTANWTLLMRRLMKRSSFTSTQDLRERILAFIDYFNRALAKPFKWTYTSRPLKA